MKKSHITALLLATLPMVALQADTNLGANPFADDPMFQQMQKMQKEMDKVFEEFDKNAFKSMHLDPNFSKGLSLNSHEDLLDKGKHYELKMNLEGMDEKSIKIDTKENYLSVQAKSETKKEQKEGDKIIHQERHVGVVQRGMSLPKDADALNYKSEYKNGLLTITIPKKK